MKNYSPEFIKYIRIHFPEHSNKIIKAHSSAWFSRIFFPMIFFLFPAILFASVAFFFYLLKQPNLTIFANQERFADLIANISLKNTLIFIIITGTISTLSSFFIGLLIGFSGARSILFDAEKLEISVKKLWLLERSMKIDEFYEPEI